MLRIKVEIIHLLHQVCTETDVINADKHLKRLCSDDRIKFHLNIVNIEIIELDVHLHLHHLLPGRFSFRSSAAFPESFLFSASIGAKALAATKTTTAEVKTQIEAYGYATTGYADGKASAAQSAAEAKAAELDTALHAVISKEIDDDVKAAIDAEVLRANAAYDEAGAAAAAQAAAIADAAGKYETQGTAQGIVDGLKLAETYEPIGAETRAIAAAKTETQNQIAALNISQYETSAHAEATYRKAADKITSDDMSDEVWVFNCGTSTTVI